MRAVLLEAHVFHTEAQALKNLYLQESRLRRQYAQDVKELQRLRAERAEQEKKENFERLWEREKQSIRECGCEDCERLARHLPPTGDESSASSRNGFEFSNAKKRQNGKPELN